MFYIHLLCLFVLCLKSYCLWCIHWLECLDVCVEGLGSLCIDSFCQSTHKVKCDFHPLMKDFFRFRLLHCVVLLAFSWASVWSLCRLQGEEPQPGPPCPLLWQRDRKCVCERPRFSLRWDEHATAPDLCHPPRCHLVAGVGQRQSQGQRQAGTWRAMKSTHRKSKGDFAQSEVELRTTRFGAGALGLCHAIVITLSFSL